MSRKTATLQGYLVLAVCLGSLVIEIYQKARAQNWRHFWIDLALIMALSAIAGWAAIDTWNRRRPSG